MEFVNCSMIVSHELHLIITGLDILRHVLHHVVIHHFTIHQTISMMIIMWSVDIILIINWIVTAHTISITHHIPIPVIYLVIAGMRGVHILVILVVMRWEQTIALMIDFFLRKAKAMTICSIFVLIYHHICCSSGLFQVNLEVILKGCGRWCNVIIFGAGCYN